MKKVFLGILNLALVFGAFSSFGLVSEASEQSEDNVEYIVGDELVESQLEEVASDDMPFDMAVYSVINSGYYDGAQNKDAIHIYNGYSEDIVGLEFTISMNAITEDFSTNSIINGVYIDEKEEVTTKVFCPDIVIAPGEEYYFNVTYTIPSNYIDDSEIIMTANVEFADGETSGLSRVFGGMQLGSLVYMEAENEYLIEAGKTAIFDCSITNIFKDDINVTFSVEYLKNIEDLYGEEVYCLVTDVSGYIVTDINLKPGETFEVKYYVEIPASWSEDEYIFLHANAEQDYYKEEGARGVALGFEFEEYYWKKDYLGDLYCYSKYDTVYCDSWVLGQDGKPRFVDADGVIVNDEFICDGTYTYYLQYDGSPMVDRLTYHPDGKHVIYFDGEGHEVFSDFAHVKASIEGKAVDDLCFFDVYGYLYVDVVTYDKEGKNLYYANPYGVLERGKWFQFSDTVMCADGTPWSGAAGNFGYANADGTLMVNTYTYDWEGRLCYMQGNGVALY